MLFIYYPKCSTCQKALKWLNDNGFHPELRDIKLANPSAAELKTWKTKSGKEWKAFFNTSGLIYRAENLKDLLPTMSDEEKISRLAKDGMLVKRPLLITDDQIIIGFREAEYEELKK